MMGDLFAAMTVSSSGMRAQSERVRVISENVANADTTPQKPGEQPYQRQVITFKNVLDRESGNKIVKVDDIEKDTKKPFILKYDPGHPAADEAGYVKMPNVNSMIEMMDMREAQRSYEANLSMIEQSRNMMMQTINLLRAR
ncbi:MAG: flagellar basal body rod protein FlgC [Alphaproteobacteria bacterium]|nr:flagellar basal body rod protein FlgC [Alphaproteobacteria bacterium]